MKEKVIAAFVAFLIILTAAPYILILPDEDYRTPQQLGDRNALFDTVDGDLIHYELYGDPVKPAVVLIHGFGGSTFTWRKTIPVLTENGYYVLALDLKGFGLSQKGLDLNYSHESQANLVNDLMNNLGIEDAYIVGHSMGGNVAAFLAEKHPKKVKELILVDAQINNPRVQPINISGISQLATTFPILQYLRQGILRYFTFDKAKEILQSAYNNKDLVTDDDVNGYYQITRIKGWQDSLIGMIRDSYKNTLPESIDKINKPIRLIWGLQDPWINIEEGKQLNVLVKNSIMDVVEDAGHLPMEEKPDDFNTILLKDIK